MARPDGLELIFLHALPLDGAMWSAQMQLFPGRAHAPTLYRFGESLDAWAKGALSGVQGDRLVLVGCSVGGSCALEMASIAPDRIAAMVLIGTKAVHHPDPILRDSALGTLRANRLAEAWESYWRPLFSPRTDRSVIDAAARSALGMPAAWIANGVAAFHSRKSRGDVLSTFPRPIVFVTGEDDPAPGPATTRAQAVSAPCSRCEIVPDCGHYVPIEQPERLNAILTELIGSL